MGFLNSPQVCDSSDDMGIYLHYTVLLFSYSGCRKSTLKTQQTVMKVNEVSSVMGLLLCG